MDDGGAGREHPGPLQHGGRREPGRLLAGPVLGWLFRDVHVHRHLGGQACNGVVQLVGGHGTHRVQGRPQSHSRIGRQGVGQLVPPLQPGLHRTVPEPRLACFQRLPEAAVQVAGVQQGESDPGLPGGLGHGELHLVTWVA